MNRVMIYLNGEGKFADLDASECEHVTGDLIEFAGLPYSTEDGKPSVVIRINGGEKALVAEIAMEDLLMVASMFSRTYRDQISDPATLREQAVAQQEMDRAKRLGCH